MAVSRVLRKSQALWSNRWVEHHLRAARGKNLSVPQFRLSDRMEDGPAIWQIEFAGVVRLVHHGVKRLAKLRVKGKVQIRRIFVFNAWESWPRA